MDKCEVCGTANDKAQVQAACAARDANGGHDRPTRLWRAGRKIHTGEMSLQAHTDGRGWRFLVHTTLESAWATCQEWNKRISGTPADQRYVPVEVFLPPHPAADVRYFMDGNQWCCVHGDFVNLQESPAGFGVTIEDARAALAAIREARR